MKFIRRCTTKKYSKEYSIHLNISISFVKKIPYVSNYFNLNRLQYCLSWDDILSTFSTGIICTLDFTFKKKNLKHSTHILPLYDIFGKLTVQLSYYIKHVISFS